MRVLLAFFLILTYSQSAQSAREFQKVVEITGNVSDYFGGGLNTWPDVDGDGTKEILVSEIHRDPTTTSFVVFSSTTGERLFTIEGSEALAIWGETAATVGDINGDNIADVVVSQPYTFQYKEGRRRLLGEITWISGKTGEELFSLAGTAGSRIGDHVLSLGDYNGDGIREVLTHDAREEGFRGVVRSGKDGTELYVSPVFNSLDTLFENPFTLLPDLNGDGLEDFSFYVRGTGPNRGSVSVHSGQNGEHLLVIDPHYGSSSFGRTAELFRDFDGDGTVDWFVGDPGADVGTIENAGRLMILSGKDLEKVLWSFEGKEENGFMPRWSEFWTNQGDGENPDLVLLKSVCVRSEGSFVSLNLLSIDSKRITVTHEFPTHPSCGRLFPQARILSEDKIVVSFANYGGETPGSIQVLKLQEKQ